MSEQQNNDNQAEANQEQASSQLSEDLSPVVEQLRSELDSLKAHANKLLDEKKTVQAKAREQEEMARLAQEEKAKKNGDFEQMLKSSEEKRKSTEEELNKLRNFISSEKIGSQSLKIAMELADGPNAELLSEFIKPRLKWTDEGVKVLDQNGNLTVSTVEDLKREFTSSERYKSLLRGSKASGSGAVNPSSSASGGQNTIKRADFEQMSAKSKAEHFKNGGKIID